MSLASISVGEAPISGQGKSAPTTPPKRQVAAKADARTQPEPR